MGDPPPHEYQQPQSQSQSQGSSGNALPVLAHVLGLITGFLGPLIIFLTARDDPAARRHASAALNWQLSLLVYSIGAMAVLGVGSVVVSPLFFLLFVALPVLMVADLVMCLVGAVKSGNGEDFSYFAAIPFTRAA